MKLVFNELSLADKAVNHQSSIDEFENFLRLYNKLVSSSVGFSRDLCTSVDMNSIELYPGYYVSQWRNNKSNDMDLRVLFKRICDRQIIQYSNEEIEISYEDKVGQGLNIAYLNGFPIISINSLPIWNMNTFECNLYSLQDDNDSKIVIKNFSVFEHIKLNESYISSIRITEQDIENIKYDANIIKELFQNLIFHDVAMTQLKNNVEIQHLDTIIKKLRILDDYFSKWNGKVFDQNAFPPRAVSPQSTETLKRFEKEHTFDFGDLIGAIVVSWHIRYTGNIPGRIYFEPNCKLKKGLICSLTTKLPTVSEPKLNVR